MKMRVLKQRFAKRERIFMPAEWAAGPCLTPIRERVLDLVLRGIALLDEKIDSLMCKGERALE